MTRENSYSATKRIQVYNNVNIRRTEMSSEEKEERDIDTLAAQIVQRGVGIVKHRKTSRHWDTEATRRWKCASEDLRWLRRWEQQQDLMDQALREQNREETSEITQDRTMSSGESSSCFSPLSNVAEPTEIFTEEPIIAGSLRQDGDDMGKSEYRSMEEATVNTESLSQSEAFSDTEENDQSQVRTIILRPPW